ncbi:MAG TPA: ASCH domain-containing protein [Chthonomonadaceae bacterium]|nr:ASCH domain-containing protein [Chthonomonadaceae bacterium]
MYALNFYSEFYEDVLRNGRKTLTIRLGDKSDKYRAGMIVWVTIGPRFGKRQKLFSAVLDRVEVKTIDSLSPREIQKENPEFRTSEDLVQLLRRIYTDDISVEDTVTVIHFSPISEY